MYLCLSLSVSSVLSYPTHGRVEDKNCGIKVPGGVIGRSCPGKKIARAECQRRIASNKRREGNYHRNPQTCGVKKSPPCTGTSGVNGDGTTGSIPGNWHVHELAFLEVAMMAAAAGRQIAGALAVSSLTSPPSSPHSN